MAILWFIAGAAIASACWWIYTHGLHGVIADMNDAAKKVTTKV